MSRKPENPPQAARDQGRSAQNPKQNPHDHRDFASRDSQRGPQRSEPPDKPSSQVQQMTGKTQRRGQVNDERERVQVESQGNEWRDVERETAGADTPEGTEAGDKRQRKTL